jgi:sigma-B regulation protein RsbU (phosphoserine phosphatase)
VPQRTGPSNRLRDIQAITDTALSRLSHEDLLAELLDRVKEIFQADTAAVLLLERSREYLVAAAAAGLEEEVAQGVRIPLGAGFAGRIAAERKAVILDKIDQSTVVNPILVDRNIRTMMGVPMVTGGQVIGVMHVGSMTDRSFTHEDAELLQVAADRAAAAVQSIATRADSIAAGALQRSLVPSALPRVAGAELAARYIAGQGNVGGDWYDAFVLPSGELGLVVGDVAGSGLPAAVVMGRMRSALRAYALDNRDPAEVLAKLDAKMQHFEPGALATVLYAVFDRTDEVRVSCAGHLPPVVAVPGRPSELADVHADLMIGVLANADRQAVSVSIPPGGLMALYTDGLVERRETPLEDGLSQLCGAIRPSPPDAVCSAVMGAMIGSKRIRDDTALLVFRRREGEVSART